MKDQLEDLVKDLADSLKELSQQMRNVERRLENIERCKRCDATPNCDSGEVEATSKSTITYIGSDQELDSKANEGFSVSFHDLSINQGENGKSPKTSARTPTKSSKCIV